MKGNPYAHVVLRGGGGKPNYDTVSIQICEEELQTADLDSNIMIDCSHANSANPKTNKRDYNLQPLVLKNLTS